MGYRLGNKSIELDGKRPIRFIASGDSEDVYRFQRMILKIFQDGEMPIDKKMAEYLSSISTERILLPRKLLFYNNSFRGYSMKLVPKKGSGRRIITTPKNELIMNIEVLEEDIQRLSRRKVLLNGVSPSNSIFNGELYFTNPNRYTLFDISNFEELEKLNRFQLHLLLTELIASELHKGQYPPSTVNMVREMMGLRDTDQSSSSYLKDVMDGQENIKQMVKKIS